MSARFHLYSRSGCRARPCRGAAAAAAAQPPVMIINSILTRAESWLKAPPCPRSPGGALANPWRSRLQPRQASRPAFFWALRFNCFLRDKRRQVNDGGAVGHGANAAKEGRGGRDHSALINYCTSEMISLMEQGSRSTVSRGAGRGLAELVLHCGEE